MIASGPQDRAATIPCTPVEEYSGPLHKHDRFRGFGLLILRVGIGVAFLLHGHPRILGGAKSQTRLGQALGSVGRDFRTK